MELVKDFKNYSGGVLLTAVITAVAFSLHHLPVFQTTVPLSPLIIAIFIGIVLRNIVKIPVFMEPGIEFAAKRLLRLAVILLGFRLSFGEVIKAGPEAISVVAATSTLSILFTLTLGRKLGLPVKRALLLASGISVCGASAVAAVDGVVQGKKEDTAFAIGTVTVMGTIYMILYPIVYRTFHIADPTFALWAGSSIHEVAQVAAAASAIPDSAMEALASTVKMLRVLLIIPLTFILLFFNWNDDASNSGKKGKVAIPWFAIFFFVAIIINSTGIIPAQGVHAILTAETLIMTCAMSGLGLGIAIKKLIGIGGKALILGLIGSIFISLASACMIHVMGLIFG